MFLKIAVLSLLSTPTLAEAEKALSMRIMFEKMMFAVAYVETIPIITHLYAVK